MKHWDQRDPSERPVDQPVQRGCCLSGREHTPEFPSPEDTGDLGGEMLRSGERGTWRDELAQCFAAGGVGDQFDAGGGVDDDNLGGQTSPSARASASVSTARTASLIGV
ncbi:MAG: hypothetical protein NVS3B21_08970 [Acidimicrobiales bacterium]